MTTSPIAMGIIEAIINCYGRNQHHYRDAQKCSWDESSSNATSASEPQGGHTNKHNKGVVRTLSVSWWYSSRNDNHRHKKCQSPRCKCNKCNQEPGGPLNGKPQTDWAYSCLRSPKTRTMRTTTKHTIKNLQKIIKNTATWHLRHTSRTQHLLDEWRRQSTDTNLSNNKTSASCDNINKDKNYHLHFDKKLKAGCVVVVFLGKSEHLQLSQVKRAKRKRHFLHSWTTISILQTPPECEWDLIPLMQTSIGLMMSQIWSILTNDSPPLVELVKVLRVQNIQKSYDTNQDYKIVKNCLIWKQQTLTVQFLW